MTSFTFFLIFVPLLAFILLAVNLILAPHTPYQEKNSPFECGFHSFIGQNRTQFSISFFIFALLFLLFDLEILLVYPYVVSAYTNDFYGLIIMLIFFLALTLGFAFELGKNALKIDSRQVSNIANVKLSVTGLNSNISLLANLYLLANINITYIFAINIYTYSICIINLIYKKLIESIILLSNSSNNENDNIESDNYNIESNNSTRKRKHEPESGIPESDQDCNLDNGESSRPRKRPKLDLSEKEVDLINDKKQEEEEVQVEEQDPDQDQDQDQEQDQEQDINNQYNEWEMDSENSKSLEEIKKSFEEGTIIPDSGPTESHEFAWSYIWWYIRKKWGQPLDQDKTSLPKTPISEDSNATVTSKDTDLTTPDQKALGESLYDSVIEDYRDKLDKIQVLLKDETGTDTLILHLRKGIEELNLLKSGKYNTDGSTKADLDFIFETLNRLDEYLIYKQDNLNNETSGDDESETNNNILELPNLPESEDEILQAINDLDFSDLPTDFFNTIQDIMSPFS